VLLMLLLLSPRQRRGSPHARFHAKGFGIREKGKSPIGEGAGRRRNNTIVVLLSKKGRIDGLHKVLDVNGPVAHVAIHVMIVARSIQIVTKHGNDRKMRIEGCNRSLGPKEMV